MHRVLALAAALLAVACFGQSGLSEDDLSSALLDQQDLGPSWEQRPVYPVDPPIEGSPAVGGCSAKRRSETTFFRSAVNEGTFSQTNLLVNGDTQACVLAANNRGPNDESSMQELPAAPGCDDLFVARSPAMESPDSPLIVVADLDVGLVSLLTYKDTPADVREQLLKLACGRLTRLLEANR